MHQRLFGFLFNRLSSSQFGFIPGRSCLQQLLIFSHDLYRAKSSHFDSDVTIRKLSILWCIISCCISYGSMESMVTCGNGFMPI